ncbi:hypothetical protein EDC01DRAFT_636255 [Geopyxis carbonaria]|nr:hypothetical protein EDC01DRAFT_636255 [Geopyxis carbonaria]
MSIEVFLLLLTLFSAPGRLLTTHQPSIVGFLYFRNALTQILSLLDAVDASRFITTNPMLWLVHSKSTGPSKLSTSAGTSRLRRFTMDPTKDLNLTPQDPYWDPNPQPTPRTPPLPDPAGITLEMRVAHWERQMHALEEASRQRDREKQISKRRWWKYCWWSKKGTN